MRARDGADGRARVRVARVLAVVVALVVVFIAVTMVVGFPGPGMLRRYPYGDLRDLADRANAEMDYPPTCPPLPGQPVAPPQRQNHPAAVVDVLRSRVSVPDSFAATPSPSGIRPDDWAMFEGVSRVSFIMVECQ